MSIERIFSELNSRNFKFIANGRPFELPHLNTMKKEIIDAYNNTDYRNAAGEVVKYSVMMHLFNSSGNAAFIQELRKLPLREADRIFLAWWDWSGIELGKYYGALDIVNEFPNAFEMDLLELKLSFKDFFDMSLRLQHNIVYALQREMESYLFTEINNYSYRWGVIKEFLARQEENFIAANSKKEAAPYKVPRPFPEEGRHIITEDQQEKINKLLPDIF